ncbi:cobyrinate a,c-diamide synthase [Litoribacillus peritrichatus]|uniref:Cobyrinate a,c-diamide synthase n=1 Tax=Litoribacillus peritrichatus TaxID=718191 RepID=A0ABP7MEZ7_9GAMM
MHVSDFQHNSQSIMCPALIISAPSSGQGKTTATAALARLFRNQGKQVRVFKIGPDFLDPMILEQASGQPVYQLDLFMGGEQHCRHLLYQAALTSDLILIEGVMGLFDGHSSAADFAFRLNIPVVAVMDGSAMAQSFGAIAFGLANYRAGLPFAGVLANNVGSEGHMRMLRDSLPENMFWFGALFRSKETSGQDISLPSRHLGLVQKSEIEDLDERLDCAAHQLAQTGLSKLPEPVEFQRVEDVSRYDQHINKGIYELKPLAGLAVAVACDQALGFIYPANVDVLKLLGAEVVYFSPLADQVLPEADALYLPGGYPELHHQALALNQSLTDQINEFADQGNPVLAECGGMMWLVDELTDISGDTSAMLGILPGHAKMQKRLTAIAMQQVDLPEGKLAGHTFHHSKLETKMEPIAKGKSPSNKATSELIYRKGRITASYVHYYFPSNPSAVAKLFSKDVV